MAYKMLKFQYCLVSIYDSVNETKNIYSMHEFISRLSDLPARETIMAINDFKAKTEKIVTYDNRFVHISLMKMTETAMPYKVYDDDRESESIELNDDEYLGKDTHVLYDMHNHVLMLQNTREALNMLNVNYYINQLAHDFGLINDHQVLDIEPIFDTKLYNKSSKAKKIDIRFANIENVSLSGTSTLSKIISYFNVFGGISGNITISIGRKSTEKHALDYDEIKTLIDDIKELNSQNKSCFSSARLTYMEEGHSFMYDLFDDVMNDIGNIQVLPKTTIPFETIGSKMLELYNNKLPKINTIINYD